MENDDYNETTTLLKLKSTVYGLTNVVINTHVIWEGFNDLHKNGINNPPNSNSDKCKTDIMVNLTKAAIIIVNKSLIRLPEAMQEDYISEMILKAYEYYIGNIQKRFLNAFPKPPKNNIDEKRILGHIMNQLSNKKIDIQRKSIKEKEKEKKYADHLKNKEVVHTKLREELGIPSIGILPLNEAIEPFNIFFKNGKFSFNKLGYTVDSLIEQRKEKLSVEQQVKNSLIQLYLRQIRIENIFSNALDKIGLNEERQKVLLLEKVKNYKFKDEDLRKRYLGYVKLLMNPDLTYYFVNIIGKKLTADSARKIDNFIDSLEL